MTDLATLAIKIDSTQAKTAADNLNLLGKASSAAEGSVNSAGKEWVRAGSAAAQLRMQSQQAAQGTDKLAMSARNAGQAASQMAKDAQQAAAGMTRVTASAGAQRAGMQQLSYQLGDVATMFAMGARPMQIFASQGGQVVGALGLMTSGSKGLLGVLGGPWGIVMISAATVVGTLVSSLMNAEKATKSVEFASRGLGDAQSILGNVMDLTTGKINTQSQALMNLARAQAVAGQIEARRLRISAEGQMDSIARYRAQVSGGPVGGLTLRRVRSNAADIIEGFREGSLNEREALTGVRSMLKTGLIDEKQWIEATDAINNYAKAIDDLKAMEDLEAGLHGDKSKIVQFLKLKTDGHKASKAALSAEQKAYEQRVKTSEQFAASLQEETARIGKTATEIKKMEIAAAAAAAPTAVLAQRIRDAGKAWEEAAAAEAARKSEDTFAKRIKALQDEHSLLGLVGEEREKAALYLEQEAFMAEHTAVGVQRATEMWEEYLRTRLQGIAQKTALERDLEAAQMLEEQLGSVINQLANMAGIGGGLGRIFGALSSGNPLAGLASMGGSLGKIGSLGAILMNPNILFSGIEKVAAGLGKLGLGGALSGGIATGLGGAMFGGLLGSFTGSSTGGALGGGIAGLANMFGAGLGPIGLIAGGLLGGVLGSLFGGGAKWGRATITDGSGDFDIEGNKGKFKDAAASAGSAVVDALNQIANELGGTVGEFERITVGVRDGKWRVNVGGTSLKTSNGAVDFGKDGGEAAIAYAIQQAIKIGAIDGLRESTLNLLKAGDDFEAALQKALAFENVFKSLEAQTNPLKVALDSIQKEFEQLTAIFREAGATAAEYAQLEAYIQQQRAAAIDAASATYRANFYTAAENEAYAKQQIKTQMTALGHADVDTVAEYKRLVESIDTSTEEGLIKYGELMALADEFATLQQAAEQRAAEAAAAQAQAQALALQKGQMEVELLRLQGKETEALAKARQLELQAMDQSLRSLQQQIYAAQDLAEAKEVLRTAYERESAELTQTVEKFKAFSTSLRDFRESLYSGPENGQTYTQALAKLIQVGGLAATGDETALGNLAGVGRDFIDVATARAGSAQDIQRALALVANYTDQAIGFTDNAATVAEQQLEQMKTQVGALIDINENVITVEQAIERLTALMGPSSSGGTGSSGGRNDDGGDRDRIASLFEQITGQFRTFGEHNFRQARAIEDLRQLFRNASPDGLSFRFSNDPKDPISVVVTTP